MSKDGQLKGQNGVVNRLTANLLPSGNSNQMESLHVNGYIYM